MKLFGHFGLCLLALGIGTQVWAQEKTFYIEVENPWEQNKPDYPIVLKTALQMQLSHTIGNRI